MKSSTLLFAAISLALPLTTLAAESGHHDHHGAAPQKIELNAGKKWATDASLRKGMGAIREQVSAALPAAHEGKLTPEQYEKLGKELNGQVAYIVQNCKLDPKADAQLHVIIGELGQGVDTMEGKQGTERALGVVQAAEALNTYGKYFDHVGWKPVKLPH
ncbi:MAG TPA: hypothetical protein VJ698_04960 [Noviherbaspirillum sp.]|uniref:hypothetical protein n=1 Tax=Noviherbaspirillum sp. TaxID=1926288 RepID=UPI002B467890|nr:hypothetical protein [Noviherbaspirillum sp.]HJV84805.1 hypothetical protein [Noviherbaspirillum sp.]